MKKLFLIIGILLMITSVNASENYLYFSERDNKIIYESDNGDIFMKHLDLVPGTSFTDEIKIKNNTAKSYKLYLKINVGNQTALANEFLNKMNMKLYLDNDLIYNGKMIGMDYLNNGVNLQDSILLREFSSSDSSILKVEAELDSTYNNTNFNEEINLKWTFYAQYDDNTPIEIVPVPNTEKNSFSMIMFSIIIIIIGIFLIIYAKKQKN